MLGFTYDDGNLHLCDGMGATIEGYFKGSEVICCVDCALGTPCEERVPGYTSADGTWRPVKHLGGRPADALSKAAAEFTEATDVIYDNGHRGGNVVAQAEDGALKWTVKDYGERFLRASTERLDGHGEAVFVHIAVVLSDGRVGRYSSPQAPEMPAAVAECFRDFSLSRQ